MPLFERYIGIDYSGARTPECSLQGLSVFMASPGSPPGEIRRLAGNRKHWSRRSLAEWLATELIQGPRTLVGIDHAFSFPLRYFEVHHLPLDWPGFLADFQRHWPADQAGLRIDDIRAGRAGKGAARSGDSRWRRLAEQKCKAKSVFHFDVQGSVAKSTQCGLPWLNFLRSKTGERLHAWPFDGWTPSRARHVIAEVYPALWNKTPPAPGHSPHQHDAFSIVHWMRQRDADGTLDDYFSPALTPAVRKTARIEGWILGLA